MTFKNAHSLSPSSSTFRSLSLKDAKALQCLVVCSALTPSIPQGGGKTREQMQSHQGLRAPAVWGRSPAGVRSSVGLGAEC